MWQSQSQPFDDNGAYDGPREANGYELLVPEPSSYDFEKFKDDNVKILAWFESFKADFQEFCNTNGFNHINASKVLHVTGSRSFKKSYTESDLEFAFVAPDENIKTEFNNFTLLCKYMKSRFESHNKFIALTTKAGLPLLICSPQDGERLVDLKLDAQYSNHMLHHLEATFRTKSVHDRIQADCVDFFDSLTPEQTTRYIAIRRFNELNSRKSDKEGNKEARKIFEDNKAYGAQKLKALADGALSYDIPEFNMSFFTSLASVVPQAAYPPELHKSRQIGGDAALTMERKSKPRA